MRTQQTAISKYEQEFVYRNTGSSCYDNTNVNACIDQPQISIEIGIKVTLYRRFILLRLESTCAYELNLNVYSDMS
jgi:hypothetical protein